ncbi:RNA polymerase factor sigma-54 [Pseudogracilibacillus sp. SE30717A]|uniref:RNA polymerase factor sigma-54 n=1 Tax=Pseudogracilibacillus sp. SE30717A TaxID=3098293 RepID=UPI00300E4DE9
MKVILEQKQMLKMVMTTELRQAIELLQLSTYELMQFIRKQAEENPLIELADTIYDTPANRTRSPYREKSINSVEFSVSEEKTLYSYLTEQLMDYELSEHERDTVEYMILNLDENGYLNISEDEICKRLNTNKETVEKANSLLQKLEPAGIGAKNLTECLLIQAKRKFPENEILLQLIEGFLQPLADKKWDQIAKQLSISLQDVKKLFDMIRLFNPKPASSFSSEKVEYVTPDIFISKTNDKKGFTVTLNDYYLPKITYNHSYYLELTKTRQVANYVKDYFKKYEWLQRSIEQRRETIIKIMKVVIGRQHAYLTNGSPASIQALTLKEVAREIGMHESTVSRATANKIVQTPIGTFELRRLFSTKLSSPTGEAASQLKVKALLKKMINEEDKCKPLSDQKLSNLMKEEGILVSRRTIAKYREELNILSSTKRKEIKITNE